MFIIHVLIVETSTGTQNVFCSPLKTNKQTKKMHFGQMCKAYPTMTDGQLVKTNMKGTFHDTIFINRDSFLEFLNCPVSHHE